MNDEPIIPGPATPLERGAGAMETTPDEWAKSVGMSMVPAHMNDIEGGFCTGGEKMQPNGRCQYGCEHADHYANDGHPECEDRSGEPGYQDGPEKWVPEAIAEQEEYIERFKADKNGRCEETVVVDGQRQACDRPLDARGYCDRPSDHTED